MALKDDLIFQATNRVRDFALNYLREVERNKQTPFFNNTGNNPVQWAGKVVQDVKQRGAFEGLHDITYPITMNPYVKPILEPIVSKARVANYKSGRKNNLVNSLLGQKRGTPGVMPKRSVK